MGWVSVDELGNCPTRFWVSLITALRCCEQCTPNVGETTMALLQSPQPPPLSTILSALLHELESREAHPAPIVLMVDDYQVISDPAIHEGMSFFLEHLPAKVHLILSSRMDLRGQMLQEEAHALVDSRIADHLIIIHHEDR